METEGALRILIVDDDTLTTTWLRTRLEKEKYAVDVARNAREALDHIHAHSTDLVVVERLLPDLDGVDLCRRLREEAEGDGLWIIILSTKADQADIVAGLSAGADDYIPKRPGADGELIAKIKMMAARPERKTSSGTASPEENKHGHIISFLGAKGGCGTSTLAVNTTYAIQQMASHASTLLVDMVFPLGSIGPMIGLEFAETLAQLSHQLKPRVDRKVISSFIAPTKPYGFSVLLSAKDLQEAQSVEVSQIAPLFKTLRMMFDFIIVDIGRSLSRLTLPVIEASDLIYVLVSPDVNAVALTKLSLDYILSLQIPRDCIIVLQNRTVPRSWLSKDDLEKQLSIPIAFTIPYDGEQMPLATNAHVPYLARYGNTGAAATLHAIGEQAIRRLGYAVESPVLNQQMRGR